MVKLKLPTLRKKEKFDDTLYSRIFRDLKGKTVLEVGCGRGRQIALFAGEGCICYGLEINKLAIKNSLQTRRINMVVGDACHLPFRTDSLDIVFSHECISHVTDIMIALHEQYRVLRTKGQLLIRDGNLLFPLSLFDLLMLYPIRTKGKYGGLRWLFTRDKVKKNIYGSKFAGKDENYKTLFWWKKQVRLIKGLKLEIATTSYTIHLPKLVAPILEPIAGQNTILLRKTSSNFLNIKEVL